MASSLKQSRTMAARPKGVAPALAAPALAAPALADPDLAAPGHGIVSGRPRMSGRNLLRCTIYTFSRRSRLPPRSSSSASSSACTSARPRATPVTCADSILRRSSARTAGHYGRAEHLDSPHPCRTWSERSVRRRSLRLPSLAAEPYRGHPRPAIDPLSPSTQRRWPVILLDRWNRAPPDHRERPGRRTPAPLTRAAAYPHPDYPSPDSRPLPGTMNSCPLAWLKAADPPARAPRAGIQFPCRRGFPAVPSVLAGESMPEMRLLALARQVMARSVPDDGIHAP